MKALALIWALSLGAPAHKNQLGECLYWHTWFAGASSRSPGGSGATLSVGGAQSDVLYYLMDATNEYLYFTFRIPERVWDGASDPVVRITWALNANETAGDKAHTSVSCEYGNPLSFDDMDALKTQTRSPDYTVLDANKNAGVMFRQNYVLDWDLGGNVIEEGDRFFCKVWLDDVSTAPIIAALRFLAVSFRYRSCYPQQDVDRPYPTE